jgi:acid phosphatase
VFIVVEENTDYAAVIGNPAMPYLNSLASQNALATNYFANTHPSIGDYFMLTTGQIITSDDQFSGTVTVDNVVRELSAAGKSWHCYAESLPSAGYTGPDVFPYLKHHNPFAYLSDVTGSSADAANIVPFSQFASDLASGSLPQYSFIIPDALHDAHSCPTANPNCTQDERLAAADGWLQSNIAPLIASSTFQQDGVVIISFDESATDNTNGGGRVANIIIGPKVKKAFQSATLYQHQNTLKLSLETLGVKNFPGAAANSTSMGEFFAQP